MDFMRKAYCPSMRAALTCDIAFRATIVAFFNTSLAG